MCFSITKSSIPMTSHSVNIHLPCPFLLFDFHKNGCFPPQLIILSLIRDWAGMMLSFIKIAQPYFNQRFFFPSPILRLKRSHILRKNKSSSINNILKIPYYFYAQQQCESHKSTYCLNEITKIKTTPWLQIKFPLEQLQLWPCGSTHINKTLWSSLFRSYKSRIWGPINHHELDCITHR